MATLQDYSAFLNDLMVRYQTLFGFNNVLYSEMSGKTASPDGIVVYDPSQERVTPLSNAGRDAFSGAQVRVPIQAAEVPGAAGVGRAGIWPVTAPFDTAKALVKLAELAAPIGIDLATERDSKNLQYSALSYVEALTDSAYRGLAKIENDMLHGNGDGKLATITQTATSLGPVTVLGADGVAPANFDQLTPGRVVNVLTASTGADPGQGLRRKIASVSRTNGTVTFQTAQVASDGGSGNITMTANTTAIYIDSSWDGGATPGALGKSMQGFGMTATSAGTPFEGIDPANTPAWGALLTAGGGATLSDSMFEDSVYQLAGQGIDAPDFAIAHPKVVDPYKDTKTQFLMIHPETRVVPSGFSGIVVQVANQDFPLLKDLAAPHNQCRVIHKSCGRLYGDSVGPAFIQDDGGMWRFFTRQSYKEAVILDRVNFVFRAPNHVGLIQNVAG